MAKETKSVAVPDDEPNGSPIEDGRRIRRPMPIPSFGRIIIDESTGEPRWLVPLTAIFPDDANPNTHPEDQIQFLMRNFRRFGQRKPIVLREDRMIVAGNGTYDALMRLAEQGVFVWSEEFGEAWVTMANTLTKSELVAYGLADNRLAKLSTLNLQIAGAQLRALEEEGFFNELEDPSMLGFNEAEQSTMGLLGEENENESETSDESEEGGFKRFDGKEETTHRCPKCKFEWAGKAK